VIDHALSYAVRTGVYLMQSNERAGVYLAVVCVRYAAALHEAVMHDVELVYRAQSGDTFPVERHAVIYYEDARTVHVSYTFCFPGDPRELYSTLAAAAAAAPLP